MLCEINPLIVTPEGEVRALDSKFTVDDNALYKHPDIAEMHDPEAVPAEERAAREKGVTYVKLDGDVGVLGNGAGLDVDRGRRHVRRRPAGELLRPRRRRRRAGRRRRARGDHGGPQVKSILFNIFGGITRCDEVARGILEALDRMPIGQPIVVRLDGTNAEEGRQILQEAAPPNRRADHARGGPARGGARRGVRRPVSTLKATRVPRTALTVRGRRGHYGDTARRAPCRQRRQAVRRPAPPAGRGSRRGRA